MLGEMALCAKKRPPGKRQEEVEIHATIESGCCYAQGAKGRGTTGDDCEEGRLQPLPIPGEPRKQTSSP